LSKHNEEVEGVRGGSKQELVMVLWQVYGSRNLGERMDSRTRCSPRYLFVAVDAGHIRFA
jgi:hypothetical protein